jgi:hypothetical protein
MGYPLSASSPDFFRRSRLDLSPAFKIKTPAQIAGVFYADATITERGRYARN